MSKADVPPEMETVDDPSIPLLTDRIFLPAVDLDTALPASLVSAAAQKVRAVRADPRAAALAEAAQPAAADMGGEVLAGSGLRPAPAGQGDAQAGHQDNRGSRGRDPGPDRLWLRARLRPRVSGCGTIALAHLSPLCTQSRPEAKEVSNAVSGRAICQIALRLFRHV